MLDPQCFNIDGYEFEFTPLRLTPARGLYADLLHYFGGNIGSFFSSISFDKEVTLETDLGTVIAPILKGVAGMVKDFSLSFDSNWYSKTMTNLILPNLKVTLSNGHAIPKEDLRGWYEIEFAQKCVTDLQVFIKCLNIQFNDFLALSGIVSIMKDAIPKNSRNLNFLRDLIGKFSESSPIIE